MLVGKNSWKFTNRPTILASGVVVGPFEGRGNLSSDFDVVYDDLWMNENSYEKAQRLLISDAIATALDKAKKKSEDVNFFLGGDLQNQMTPTNFTLNDVGIPCLGVFSACATAVQALVLGAFLVNYEGAKLVVCGASSHNAAVERQFRYPTEYGGQKPPTAQWTVTGAGMGLIGSTNFSIDKNLVITEATVGKVIDMGISDPFNMGGAMAAAAVDTIFTHLKEFNRHQDSYDCIYTGDLGKIGSATAFELLHKKGINIAESKWKDCGLLIYSDEQSVQSGGSGAGCVASVFFGHICNEMRRGNLQKVIVCATGALLSPLTFQQGDSIPCIAHAMTVELI